MKQTGEPPGSLRWSRTLPRRHHQITALFFRRIQRRIGPVDQTAGNHMQRFAFNVRLSGLQRRHTNTDSQKTARTGCVRHIERADITPYAFGDIHRLHQASLRQDNQKLFTTVTADVVAATQARRGERAGNQTQAIIPGLMPLGIVVVFEVVDIRQTHRQRKIILQGAGNLGQQALIHIATVKQPGQMIVL